MSDSNDITVLDPGLYKNLLTQVESIYRHSNELSFKTRARYFEATKIIFLNFKKIFLNMTLVVRVDFYNVLAAVGNRDADFRKARGDTGDISLGWQIVFV